ncbi:UDP-N-acetylmuramoyl-tripeptide--D-alanyl-D-alanine ligase [Tepidimicrobium xylanilyticum]|uniref:UDP-N-acetylmuramoyl-tripeptide--D-alanyl-D-alanine ligase n=1 Tax=Tepidimicrobium xylanilyticum TaxID=1123352 RepID=A0A1H3A1C4_9FIRM|nr:UDP-N-acetylmuramoyl-tripeptide--D-alanyl-D-alanine ligase [Tepidimicrobium xylanilyticum]GMG96345.1 Mur ligase [Tepidimicrobium xylanilyticum]SDX23426.1 UDP-N-acetylmuramoyl-tripeptide--D-alanyl-D-alanine ligase [Tepidimicrobium xylanilyticum]
MVRLISISVVLIWMYFLVERSKFFLHMMQLEGYKGEQYRRWLQKSEKVYSKRLKKYTLLITTITLLFIIEIIILAKYEKILNTIWLGQIVLWIILMTRTLNEKDKEAKKPLVLTNRAKRLFVTNFLLNIIAILMIYILYMMLIDEVLLFFPVMLLFGTFLYYLQPEILYFSNIIVKPLEDRINLHFYRKAQRKISSMNNLHVIGITGSFGKTSTKFITGTILKEKYRVLNTPESYNTPMGLSMVINNQLNEKHQVFIAEMGARNIGDIKELAKLTKPRIGVITSIGPTHLETFKNLENIMKTKFELIEELPTDGIAILNYDDEHIKKLADKTFKEKILYGMEDVDKLDIFAEDVEVSEKGSTFTIKDKKGNNIRCTTRLLGKHNIYNILAGVSVAIAMGMNLEEIKRGIEKIEPVPHRLNIINPGTGITIIDDAFNSNPIGAKAALEVLSQFKEGRKIIVTPGMVELGAREEEANRELGVNIGKVCDFAILVGEKRTIPIYEGLMEIGYNKDNVFVVSSLDEATKIIQKIARPKDVILFENDLPDNYSE